MDKSNINSPKTQQVLENAHHSELAICAGLLTD